LDSIIISGGRSFPMNEKMKKIPNIILPIAGIALVIYYKLCDTSCAYISGSFLGIDLKYIGILFMAVLLILTIPAVLSCRIPVDHLRTMMLSGAMGGEVILFRFQVVHETFCPYCLAFGLCLLILFAVNFRTMNKYLSGASFLAGIAAFALFFRGAVLPLY
jgi:uncharacterized membrane protein